MAGSNGINCKETIMTPNDIDVLLHCFVSPSVHPRLDAPAVQETIARFIEQDLITRVTGSVYKTTSRGNAHVQQLCNLPLPTSAWLDEHNRVIGGRCE